MNKVYHTKEWETKIREACLTELSMAKACASIGMNTNTFIAHAKRLGVYNTNQSGKGISKKFIPNRGYELKDILESKYPQYQSHRLKQRLIKEKVKEHKCEGCEEVLWLNKPIPLELHHKDGNSKNHKLENLSLLCPNCHAFTETYRAKNIQKVQRLNSEHRIGEEKVQTTNN